MIDTAGKLTVRPLGNGASGNLGANPAGNTQSAPWRDQSESIQIAYDIANGGHAERRDLAWMRSRADVTGPAGAPDGAVDAQDAFAIQRAALLGWGEAI